MNVLTRVISAALEETFRIVKVLRFGKDDVQTADVAAPYGVDSNPVTDMIAVFSETAEDGKAVIVGYLNQDQLAQPGELRLYSTDDDAGLKAYVWLKKDGTILLGGDADHAVRYAALNQALQDMVTKLNAQLTLIQTGITGVGGTYAKQNVTLDISPAKINEIKTP